MAFKFSKHEENAKDVSHCSKGECEKHKSIFDRIERMGGQATKPKAATCLPDMFFVHYIWGTYLIHFEGIFIFKSVF